MYEIKISEKIPDTKESLLRRPIFITSLLFMIYTSNYTSFFSKKITLEIIKKFKNNNLNKNLLPAQPLSPSLKNVVRIKYCYQF